MKKLDYTQIYDFPTNNNQIAARGILYHLKNNHRYVRLYAQMQSGKTSVSAFVGEECLNKDFDHIVFFISESSIDLNNQNMLAIKNHLRLRGVEDIDDKCTFLHRAQLKKLMKNKELMGAFRKKKTLLIIDESHLASQKGSGKEALTKSLGFSFASPPKQWNNKKLSILTISATPFPEEMIHEFQEKELEQLISKPVTYIPGKNYLSINEMFKRGLIHQAEQVVYEETGKFNPFFLAEMKKFIQNKDKKYIAIIRNRALSQKHNEELRKHLTRELKKYTDFNIKMTICTSANDFKLNEIRSVLKNESNTTKTFEIVLVDQKARVGLDISTDNVYLVWDSPKSNTASVAQSLAGRCCGYKFKNNVKVFCDKENLSRYRDWVDHKISDKQYIGKLSTSTGASDGFSEKYIPSFEIVDQKNLLVALQKYEGKKWKRNFAGWTATNKKHIVSNFKRWAKDVKPKAGKKGLCHYNLGTAASEETFYSPIPKTTLIAIFKTNGKKVKIRNESKNTIYSK